MINNFEKNFEKPIKEKMKKELFLDQVHIHQIKTNNLSPIVILKGKSGMLL